MYYYTLAMWLLNAIKFKKIMLIYYVDVGYYVWKRIVSTLNEILSLHQLWILEFSTFDYNYMLIQTLVNVNALETSNEKSGVSPLTFRTFDCYQVSKQVWFN